MTCLFVLNDGPYVSERTWNSLRLATALAADGDNTVNVFLIGDAVTAAVAGQAVPEGAHDIGWMLGRLAPRARILCCRTCMEARGIAPEALMEGAARGTLDQLAAWTAEADKVLVF